MVASRLIGVQGGGAIVQQFVLRSRWFIDIPNNFSSSLTRFLHKILSQNAGNGITETLLFKIFFGGACPRTPLEFSAFGARQAN